MRRSVFALLLLLAVAARADDRVLRIGDSKGVYRALLAAGAIDLRGRRVATNKGSVGHHLVLAALQREKIPFRDVTIEFLLPSDAKAALGGGSVDAWSTWDP